MSRNEKYVCLWQESSRERWGRCYLDYIAAQGESNLCEKEKPQEKNGEVARDALRIKTGEKITIARLPRSRHLSQGAIVRMLTGLVNEVDDRFPIVLRISLSHTAIAAMSE